jgi:hypothetical protein
MALAVNGSGTIFKKCDRSNHRPDSNKSCASSTCQHTCDTPERGQHARTLRYWVNGKQVTFVADGGFNASWHTRWSSSRRLATVAVIGPPQRAATKGGSLVAVLLAGKFITCSRCRMSSKGNPSGRRRAGDGPQPDEDMGAG